MAKQDNNTVIGFVLMALILAGFSIYNGMNQPQTTPNKQTIETSQTNTENATKQLASTPTVVTPIDSQAVEYQSYTLENDVLYLEVSNKDAQITKVYLKGYKTYSQDSLFLINDNSNKVTYDWGQEYKDDSPFIVRNTANSIQLSKALSDGTIVSYEYVLPSKDNYFVNYNVTTSTPKAATLYWEMSAFRQEKSPLNEDRYTELIYGYGDENYDYLSAGGKDEETESNVQWIGYKNQFFTSILINPKSKFNQVDFASAVLPIDAPYVKEYKSKTQVNTSNIPLELEWFFGPNEYDVLKAREDVNIYRVIPLGWGIFGWINRFVVINIFDFFKGFGLSFGLVILLLTIIIKLILTPVTYKNFVSSAKMRAVKPFIDEINQKYKDKDQMFRQQKTMELYNKVGVNPMAGCLPLFIQMPILLALFRFFPASIALRQQSFLWADDLAAYDSVWDLGFNIPFYGDHVSLFALLMSISTLVYTMMTSSNMPQSNQPGMPNMKVMMYAMPVLMIFWFNDYSSGLSYYYLMANIINIGQMVIIKKYVINEDKLQANIAAMKDGKGKAKKSRLQRKMDSMLEQAKQQRG